MLVSYGGKNSVYTGQLLWSKCGLHWSVIVVKILSTLVSYWGHDNILPTLVKYCGHNSVYTGQSLWGKFCLHWSIIAVKILSTLVSYCGQNYAYTG